MIQGAAAQRARLAVGLLDSDVHYPAGWTGVPASIRALLRIVAENAATPPMGALARAPKPSLISLEIIRIQLGAFPKVRDGNQQVTMGGHPSLRWLAGFTGESCPEEAEA